MSRRDLALAMLERVALALVEMRERLLEVIEFHLPQGIRGEGLARALVAWLQEIPPRA
jgi:hypothetical protein